MPDLAGSLASALPAYAEWQGIAVFALSSALKAARKHMDPFGFFHAGDRYRHRQRYLA